MMTVITRLILQEKVSTLPYEPYSDSESHFANLYPNAQYLIPISYFSINTSLKISLP